MWLFLLRSARGNTEWWQQQVRKLAAPSGSPLLWRYVEFHVACVLWARLWLSGRSCGQYGIDLPSFMHSIMAMSSCRKTSCVHARTCVCVRVEVCFTEIGGSPQKAIEAFISRMRRGKSSLVQACVRFHTFDGECLKPHLKCSSP